MLKRLLNIVLKARTIQNKHSFIEKKYFPEVLYFCNHPCKELIPDFFKEIPNVNI